MSEIHGTVKGDDATLGKGMYFCLPCTQEASGLAPDLDRSRQPNSGLRDSGEVNSMKFLLFDQCILAFQSVSETFNLGRAP